MDQTDAVQLLTVVYVVIVVSVAVVMIVKAFLPKKKED